MPTSANDYLLRVTAGPSYDPSTHKTVFVNTFHPTTVDSAHVTARIHVRIQNYRGLPHDSPTSSAYFEHDPHKHDLYSIAWDFVVKSDAACTQSIAEEGDQAKEHVRGINGNELFFGNDFDHPIRDSLPPGFGTAMRIVQWAVDPGLQGDVHADKPYLYGPLLSSMNVLGVGGKDGLEEVAAEADKEDVFVEGGEGDGVTAREEMGMPGDVVARQKAYLNEKKRKQWVFEDGRRYMCDFFNPYLDFNEFSLKLPGFTLPIIRYWDGQPLRYVLKHKTADGSIDRPLFVVMFTLVPKEEVEKEEAKASSGTNAADDQENEIANIPSDPQGTGYENSGLYVDEGVD